MWVLLGALAIANPGDPAISDPSPDAPGGSPIATGEDPPALAAAGGSDWDVAASALAARDLEGAAAAYGRLLVDGYIDPNVYYNLGNVHYQQGVMPLAVVAWRRAAVLAPRDPDIAANLDFARRKAVDGVVTDDPAPWFAPWQAALAASEGVWLGAGLAGLGLVLIGLRRRLPTAGALAVGGLLVATGGLVAAGGLAEARLPCAGVVLAESVMVTSDLGGGVELFELHAGAEVGVVERAAGRVLVSLPDGRKGWVADKLLGTVDPWAPMPVL